MNISEIPGFVKSENKVHTIRGVMALYGDKVLLNPFYVVAMSAEDAARFRAHKNDGGALDSKNTWEVEIDIRPIRRLSDKV